MAGKSWNQQVAPKLDIASGSYPADECKTFVTGPSTVEGCTVVNGVYVKHEWGSHQPIGPGWYWVFSKITGDMCPQKLATDLPIPDAWLIMKMIVPEPPIEQRKPPQ